MPTASVVEMPSGIPKDWTLDELQLVWEFDGNDGRTVSDMTKLLGVTRNTWYSMKMRLRDAGGPEKLYQQMLENRPRRYNRAMDPKRQFAERKRPETVQEAMDRRYSIRTTIAGRGDRAQYTLTVPPSMAVPWLERWGNEFYWTPVEDGLLLVPVVDEEKVLPTWLRPQEGSKK